MYLKCTYEESKKLPESQKDSSMATLARLSYDGGNCTNAVEVIRELASEIALQKAEKEQLLQELDRKASISIGKMHRLEVRLAHYQSALHQTKAVNYQLAAKCTNFQEQICGYFSLLSGLQSRLEAAEKEKVKWRNELHITQKYVFEDLSVLKSKIYRLGLKAKAQLDQYKQQCTHLKAQLHESENSRVCCVVCLEALPNVLFETCRHVCVCEVCSLRLSKCPKCRADIAMREKIFL